MNWTDLREKYLPLNDKDKLLRWATLNQIEPPIIGESDSYFENDKGIFCENVATYTCSNIENIENDILRITADLPNNEIIARITAVIMLKNQPCEINVRERYALWRERRGLEPDEQWIPGRSDTNGITKPAKQTAEKTPDKDVKQGEKPPEFFYPM